MDSLKAKLLEKLEQSLADLELKIEKIESAGEDSSDHSQGGSFVDSHEVKGNTLLFCLLLMLNAVHVWDDKQV